MGLVVLCCGKLSYVAELHKLGGLFNCMFVGKYSLYMRDPLTLP